MMKNNKKEINRCIYASSYILRSIVYFLQKLLMMLDNYQLLIKGTIPSNQPTNTPAPLSKK